MEFFFFEQTSVGCMIDCAHIKNRLGSLHGDNVYYTLLALLGYHQCLALCPKGCKRLSYSEKLVYFGDHMWTLGKTDLCIYRSGLLKSDSHFWIMN